MGSITDVTQSTPALDFSTFDTDVRVQDDLFRHVNGSWIERTPIPDDKPLTGSFMILRDAAEEAVRDIITGMDRSAAPDGSDEAKIADLYASFLDTDAIEAAGAQPLSEVFARIDAVTEVSELIELLGALARVGVRGLVGVDTESDPGDPNRYVMFVGQSGLGLPDEAYYREAEYAEIREAYQGHLGRMLELAGVDYPATQAQRIVELETDIAACHWDKVKTRDMRLMYNLTSLADFSGGQSRAALAYVHGRRRHRRAAHGRAGGGATVLLHRRRGPAHRRSTADLEGLAQVAGDRVVRAVPVECLRGRELRLLRHHAAGHPAAA